jgi:cytochrome P450
MSFLTISKLTSTAIGQRFAGLEERVVLATLFRRFSFRSTQTIEELQLAPGAILRTYVPIQMIVERRQGF